MIFVQCSMAGSGRGRGQGEGQSLAFLAFLAIVFKSRPNFLLRVILNYSFLNLNITINSQERQAHPKTLAFLPLSALAIRA